MFIIVGLLALYSVHLHGYLLHCEKVYINVYILSQTSNVLSNFPKQFNLVLCLKKCQLQLGQVIDFEINEMLESVHKNRGDGEVVAIRVKLMSLPVQTILTSHTGCRK